MSLSLSGIDPVALRTLAVAVRAGTFEAAARELSITPSAVSQRVKALESRIGRVLLLRSKPVVPTEAGHVLIRLATQTELLERDALAELMSGGPVDPRTDGQDDLPWAEMPLAVNADTMATWLLDVMVDMQQRHRVTFELLRDDEHRTAERLRHGDVMGAVTTEPQPVPGCRVQRLGTERYLAVATPEYVERWLPDGPTPSAMAHAPLVDFDRNDQLQRGFLRRITRKHVSPPTTYIPSMQDFDAAVRRGMGWALQVERIVADDLAAGRLVELTPGRHTDQAIFWQYWRLDSPLMDDLTEAISEAAHRWLRSRRPSRADHRR